jgi:hypothetical protein
MKERWGSGGLLGTVPELLFEKKGLILPLQQLIVQTNIALYFESLKKS